MSTLVLHAKTYTIMKQTIIALMAVALLASCEQKAEEATTENNVATTMNKEGEPPIYESLYISEAEGNQLITNYHEFLKSEVQKTLPKRDTVNFDSLKSNKNLSFMLDAKKLKAFLDSNTHIKTLDIYLARTSANDDGKMTLVYVGAKDSTGSDGEKIHVELVQYRVDDPGHTDPQVMDNVYPCPTCDRDRIHTNQ